MNWQYGFTTVAVGGQDSPRYRPLNSKRKRRFQMNVQINRSQLKFAATALAVAILIVWAPAPAVSQQPIPAAMRRAVTAKLEAAASAAGISIDPATVSIRSSGGSVIGLAFRPEREPFTSSQLARGVKAGIVYVAGEKDFVVADTKLRLPRQAYIFELVLPQGESVPSAQLVDEKKQAVLTIKGTVSDGGEGNDRTPRSACKPVAAQNCPSAADTIPSAIGGECTVGRPHKVVTYEVCGGF
jgi:hypothetical protein